MLSSLLRSKRKERTEHSPFSSAYDDQRSDYFQIYDETTALSHPSSSSESSGGSNTEDTPLLPIFSAAELDSIPVYSLVHSIRSDIISRVDTTLTWDQLRSPQVSSFLVKPILASLIQGPERISKGILYSLLANCFQFRKEAQENPGNASVSKTRALLAELLAIKLLKEFSPRELIDALSYDFYPLQGQPPPAALVPGDGHISFAPTPPRLQRASRISALEISIRAEAKKFLSHPLVIQQLEAIWTGKIVFHSALDQLHRMKDTRKYSVNTMSSMMPFRRSATLYDARDASLFKLSRLRVPRYKHITSTFSLAILLFLYVMVLVQRSHEITVLEIGFWLWSLGFMMDEIAGFTEAGVSLYFISLWNSFDMGIYLLFMAFYVLRIIGFLAPENGTGITNWGYDILASCAVFLFPRIFSVLDHYRYFSQLIIAFKIMAVDMVALLVLILISCSGFFVAFTLAFARDSYSAKDVSYALFQILMGFTPAAWEVWENYNPLGRILLTAFLIICHFLIVTILITVLTNSFAAVAANSQEEHQFLVAVNTLSLVKSDSLFSYTAPLNLLAWIIHPLRFFIPFRSFVKLNRTAIKITHFPILVLIFLYERTALHDSLFNQTNAFSTKSAFPELSDRFDTSSRRLRGGSVMGSEHQEAALDEVFRRPYKGSLRMRASKGDVRSIGTGGVVDSWMNGVVSPTGSLTTDIEGGFATRRRALTRRGRTLRRIDSYGTIEGVRPGNMQTKHFTGGTKSFVSNPEEFRGRTDDGQQLGEGATIAEILTEGDADNEGNSEDDGDDEINEDTENTDAAIQELDRSPSPQKTMTPPRPRSLEFPKQGLPIRPKKHHRTGTSTTVLNSQTMLRTSGENSSVENIQAIPMSRRASERLSVPGEGSPGRKSPRSSRPQTANRSRPVLSSRRTIDSSSLIKDHEERRRNSVTMEELARQIDTAMVPSSFATQMAMATGTRGGVGDDMLGRLVLARIGTLEEGMKDVKDILREVKKLSAKSKDKSRERGKERYLREEEAEVSRPKEDNSAGSSPR
ncbi:uncharacterized protein H6S33_009678 [Morchella sextelata]|uniref:uncharacterized protein n=1 Tax=Morchella sextelata TaxID=1174677 RepID=UPI001D04B979|nr:uncharacterized protein H6S33_009678 [Morchella sextelata]KAH0613298.1 hypothetical protein H6S33_009678 [Morchella sextelata]